MMRGIAQPLKEFLARGRFLKQKIPQLEQGYIEFVKAVAQAIEKRDPYSHGHSERVAQISLQIANRMGCSERLKRDIEMAARIHDIGKASIRDGILIKLGPLTPDEWFQIMQHPAEGAGLISSLSFLKDLLPIIEGHHEWYNGEGYPNQLKEEEIHLGARILAVADAYDSLTSERPYRHRLSREEAIEIIKRGAGSQWDPTVVQAFIEVAVQEEAVILRTRQPLSLP